MSLTRLFHALTVALLALVALAMWRVGGHDWRTLQNARAGERALQDLRVVMALTEAISNERSPSFAVLGDTGEPVGPDELARLGEGRQRTDQAFQHFRTSVLAGRQDMAWHTSALRATERAELLVHEVRLAVDSVAARARSGERRHQNDVNRLRESVRLLVPVLDELGAIALQSFPELAPLLTGARLAATLHEQAGVLATVLRPALVRQTPFAADEHDDLEHLRGRIAQLHDMLDQLLDGTRASPELAPTRQALHTGYFGRTTALVTAVVEASHESGRYPVDAQAFAATYLPDMVPLLNLRDVLLSIAQTRAGQNRDVAAQSLLVMTLATLVAAAMLVLSLWALHRRIIQPLARTVEALDALAQGQSQVALPEHPHDDEMGAVVRAVAALHESQLDRQRLEEEGAAMIRQLSTLSSTDPLTGLLNRRAFFETAERELANATRHGYPVAALLMDVDHFKQINDTHGHAVGDKALLSVALAAQAQLRSGDLLARYGGEEFVVLLGHCDLDKARRLAERLRLAVSELAVPDAVGGAFSMTVSIGLADSGHGGLDLEHLLSLADVAMYRAKRTGRNRVACSTDPLEPAAAHVAGTADTD